MQSGSQDGSLNWGNVHMAVHSRDFLFKQTRLVGATTVTLIIQ